MIFSNAKNIAVSALIAFAGTSAGAAVIDFDGLNGNPAYFEDQSFLFSPVGNSNSSLCYDNRCLQELGQGSVTTMTYDSSEGGPYGDGGQGGNSIPLSVVSPNYGDAFNLDYFYFLLTGNGEDSTNSLTVTGTFANNTTVSAMFNLLAGTGLTATGANVVYAADYDGNNNNTDNGTIQKNVGYWVDLDDNWNGVTSVTWSAGLTAQVRLDCVGANELGGLGSTNGCAPFDDDGNTGGPMNPIPLPAGLPLLASALGLGLFLRRRRS